MDCKEELRDAKLYPISSTNYTLVIFQFTVGWLKVKSILLLIICLFYLSISWFFFFFFSCVVMSSFRKCCSFCINKKEQCYSNGFICVHIDWRIDLYCINRLFSHKQAQDCAHTEKFGWISLSLESSSFVPFDGFASPGMFSIVLCKVLAWNCLKSYAYFRLWYLPLWVTCKIFLHVNSLLVR